MNAFNLIIQFDDNETEVAEVLVEGLIDDKLYGFLLDTGAAKTTVMSDPYLDNYQSLEGSESNGVFSKSKEEIIELSRIQLGSIKRTNFKVARIADPHEERRNLIGMDFLKDHRYHFYFDENKVIIDGSEASVYNERELVVGAKFHPYIDVELEGELAKAVWDTGAGITVVDLSLIEKYPNRFVPLGSSNGTDSTGATMETPVYLMNTAIIGGIVFPEHKVAGVDLAHVNSTTEIPMDMILGYSTLSKANWFFDFTRKKWAVTKVNF